MKLNWKRLLTAMLAFALVLSVVPQSLALADNGTVQLGEITAGETNFRKTASTKGELIERLNRGDLVELLSIPDTIDENHWFKVRYKGKEGYVMSTYVRVLQIGSSVPSGMTVHGYVKLTDTSVNLRQGPSTSTKKMGEWRTKNEVLPYVSTPVKAGGSTWYEVVYKGSCYWVCGDYVKATDSTGKEITGSSGSSGSSPTATPAPSTPASGYIKTTKNDVNLRTQPFGERIVWISKGEVLPYSKIVAPHASGNNSNYTWYGVSYVVKGSTVTGFVRSDCVVLCNANGSTSGSSSGSTATTPPSSAPTTGYVKTIATGVNVRKTPGGSSIEQLRLGTVVPVIGAATKASSHTWYPVRTASGKTGYVRDDVVVACNANGSTSGSSGSTGSTPTTPPTADGSYGYVKIKLDKTYIRSTPNGDKIFQIEKKGGVYPLWGTTQSKANYTWYPLYINGKYAWVRGDCVTVTDANGNAIGGSSGSSGSSGSTGSSSSAKSSYVITILNDVNLRAAASRDSKSLAKVNKNLVLAYKSTTTAGGYTWYKIVYKNQNMWVRGDCVRVMSQAEYDSWLQQNPGDEPEKDVVLGYVKTSTNNVFIRKTPGGDKIGKVIDKGTVLPYSETQVKGSYTWYHITHTDGTVGWMTGEFLITCDANGSTGSEGGNATPPSSDSSDFPMNIPVEKIKWTSANSLWKRGTTAKVYDVKTGRIWTAYRWAGGNHADAEPYTATDTVTLCRIYNVNSAKEIETKNLWQRRPCIINISSHNYACSLFGMPHAPDDGVIKNNNFPGPLCIWFVGSMGHSNQTTDDYHEAAINEAYSFAKDSWPGGRK